MRQSIIRDESCTYSSLLILMFASKYLVIRSGVKNGVEVDGEVKAEGGPRREGGGSLRRRS